MYISLCVSYFGSTATTANQQYSQLYPFYKSIMPKYCSICPQCLSKVASCHTKSSKSPTPHQSWELRCPTVLKASQAICSEEILYFSMNAALSGKKIFKISSIRKGASGFALVHQVLGLTTIEVVNQNLPQQVFYEKTPCPAQLLWLM